MTYPQQVPPMNRDIGSSAAPQQQYQYSYGYQYDQYGNPIHPQNQVQQAPQYPPQALVTRRRKNTAHAFHIFMSVITGGVWFIFVYGPLLLIRSIHKQKEVTTYG